MSRRQRARRSVRFDAPRDVRELLTALRGTHRVERGHERGAWSFAFVLAATAAVWVVWFTRDLSIGYALNWMMVGGLALCVGVAVGLAFFILKTNTDEYTFGPEEVLCTDGKGNQRWKLPCREVDAITLIRVRGGRFYCYLERAQTGDRYAIHSHESTGRILRESRLVLDAFTR